MPRHDCPPLLSWCEMRTLRNFDGRALLATTLSRCTGASRFGAEGVLAPAVPHIGQPLADVGNDLSPISSQHRAISSLPSYSHHWPNQPREPWVRFSNAHSHCIAERICPTFTEGMNQVCA